MKLFFRSLTLVFLFVCCIQIAGAVDTIEISVEVTEINNTKAKELGIKWLDSIEVVEEGYTGYTDGADQIVINGTELDVINKIGKITPLRAELKFLQENGAAEILSKPKLITKSGSKANTLIGGEFPIVVPGVGGAQGTVEWKKYGIKMNISPEVISRNNEKIIALDLNTEVSRLDWANSVQGFPSVTVRQAESSVELKSGQTMTIAGLIRTLEKKDRAGLPVLGSIPLLRYFFSHEVVTKEKSTILIFVTPKIL
ncbi:MAG: type II and III secretion system protein [Elusimicrobiota bacterium]